MIALAAVTGLRRGELLGLGWSDVSDATIFIKRSLGYTPKDGVFEDPTKTRQTRRVAIDQVGEAVIERQKAELQNAASALGIDLVPDPWLFSPEPDGSMPFHPDSISKVFHRVADAHGWRDLHFHFLRHFSATELPQLELTSGLSRLGWATLMPP